MKNLSLPLVAAVGLCLLAISSNTTPAAADANAAVPATPFDPYRPTAPLERRSYIHNLQLLAQHFPGEERGDKMQMMAIGEKRYLVQDNRILDVSDPLQPALVAEGPWRGNQIQVAYNEHAGKWIVMVSTSAGVEFYDLSNPRRPNLLSQWAGGSTHRNYYDGGRYAYLSASPGGDYYTDRNIL